MASPYLIKKSIKAYKFKTGAKYQLLTPNRWAFKTKFPHDLSGTIITSRYNDSEVNLILTDMLKKLLEK